MKTGEQLKAENLPAILKNIEAARARATTDAQRATLAALQAHIEGLDWEWWYRRAGLGVANLWNDALKSAKEAGVR